MDKPDAPRCSSCDGVGWTPDSWVDCPDCGGTGMADKMIDRRDAPPEDVARCHHCLHPPNCSADVAQPLPPAVDALVEAARGEHAACDEERRAGVTAHPCKVCDAISAVTSARSPITCPDCMYDETHRDGPPRLPHCPFHQRGIENEPESHWAEPRSEFPDLVFGSCPSCGREQSHVMGCVAGDPKARSEPDNALWLCLSCRKTADGPSPSCCADPNWRSLIFRSDIPRPLFAAPPREGVAEWLEARADDEQAAANNEKDADLSAVYRHCALRLAELAAAWRKWKEGE